MTPNLEIHCNFALRKVLYENAFPMKKHAVIFISFLCLLALTSCHKSGVNLFAGDYSFKSSGELSITAQAVIDSSNIIIPAVLNASLSNDIGQLNISISDKKNDQVIVVFNYLNGEVVVTTGTCEGNLIQLDEFQRNTLPISINTPFSVSSTYITVNASGQMYDDNMIVFDMTYKGTVKIGSVTYNITDKDLKMVAYRN